MRINVRRAMNKERKERTFLSNPVSKPRRTKLRVYMYVTACPCEVTCIAMQPPKESRTERERDTQRRVSVSSARGLCYLYPLITHTLTYTLARRRNSFHNNDTIVVRPVARAPLFLSCIIPSFGMMHMYLWGATIST